LNKQIAEIPNKKNKSRKKHKEDYYLQCRRIQVRKEIIRTQYSAAEAQVKIKERVTLPQKK
jgi:hypothetical protein